MYIFIIWIEKTRPPSCGLPIHAHILERIYFFNIFIFLFSKKEKNSYSIICKRPQGESKVLGLRPRIWESFCPNANG